MNQADAVDEVQSFNISENFMSSVFKGQTIFSMYDHNKDQLNQIQQLVQSKLDQLDQDLLTEQEIPVVRQLYRVLNF